MSEENKSVMGRPRIELEEISVDGWKLLDSLIIWSAHFEYIAEQLGISEDTLNKRVKDRYGTTLTEYRNKKKEQIKINIRKAQYDLGVTQKNPTMLIWLGKNECGQSDKQEVSNTQKIEINIDSEDAEL